MIDNVEADVGHINETTGAILFGSIIECGIV
jgi:hypothetical protein